MRSAVSQLKMLEFREGSGSALRGRVKAANGE